MAEEIFLDKDKSIPWIDFDPTREDQFRVDYLLEPIARFLKNLEIHCLSECCGFNAFSFFPDEIIKAIDGNDRGKILDSLEKAKIEIENDKNSIVISCHFNQLFDRSFFLQLLEHIISVLRNN